MKLSRSTLIVSGLFVLVGISCDLPVFGQQPTAEQRGKEIDFERARTLIQKQRSGERLTADESDYLRRAKEARAKSTGRRGTSDRNPSSAGRTFVGLTPLTDLANDDRYKGRSGGLYGESGNTPPQRHLEAALAQAREIRPLDAHGHPSDDGKIVLLSIGMSNTTQEFSAFVRAVAGDTGVSKTVQVVDGAQGGMDAADWLDADTRVRRDRPSTWDAVSERLRQAKVAPQQVQAVWIKQARKNPAALGEFPKHADALKHDLAGIVRKLKNEFPNLRIAYLSSRTYAGYANGSLNPEPYAYESAFAVRSLIADQIAGKADLNFDAANGEVVAPVLLWGPYLWADGEHGRKTDDLQYARSDFGPDGTHPSDAGRRKVADQLMAFFKNDPTAKMWFTGGK